MADEATTPARPRTCLDCAHCILKGETGDWSEWTPGEPSMWVCGKGYFSGDIEKKSIRETMTKAETCSDFQADPDLKARA